MKAFLDTSVLVAAFYVRDERHRPSLDLLLRHREGEACCALHSVAETFSVLTGRTGRYRASGDGAMLFIGQVRERLALISLTQDEYFGVLESAAAMGLAGGVIYDALLGRCAVKAKAESIYTWNVKDFNRLGPDIAARVKTP
ncbi:MAG: PIN domain-containing protein [Candidatus Binataceae bacterium]